MVSNNGFYLNKEKQKIFILAQKKIYKQFLKKSFNCYNTKFNFDFKFQYDYDR